MKIRADIKRNAKIAFKSNYWTSVGAPFLVGIIITVAASMAALIAGVLFGTNLIHLAYYGDAELAASLWPASLLIYLLIAAVQLPFAVGLSSFFTANYRGEKPSLEIPFVRAFRDYGRNFGGMLYMYLFLTLWALIPAGCAMLIVLPAIAQSEMLVVLALLGFLGSIVSIVNLIIKSYSYSMTRYILADFQLIKAKEAVSISKMITRGHCGQLFLLDMSFIGWWLLSSITFGILWIFYVAPYYETVRAGFYNEIKEEAKLKGLL